MAEIISKFEENQKLGDIRSLVKPNQDKHKPPQAHHNQIAEKQ